MDSGRKITLGDSVIIRRNDMLKHVKIMAGKQQRLGSGLHVPLEQLVGHPYGSAFQLSGGKLERIKPSSVENSGEEMLDNEEDGDNREIVDNCQSQRLDRDDIQSLKESGETGENIVAKLVENSSTFRERSNFSKAKYLRKKSKKHIPHFIAEYPSARLICQLLANEQYPKAMGLQPHTLAQILTWANVRSGSNVLLFESTQSFVAGALMERLGTKGHVVQLYPGAYPVRTLLDDFNHSDDLKAQALHGYPLEKLIFLEDNDVDLTSTEKPTESTTGSSCDGIPSTHDAERSGTLGVEKCKDDIPPEQATQTAVGESASKKRKLEDSAPKTSDNTSPHLTKLREMKIKEEEIALELLRRRNFDSLIIVSKYNPKDCILTLLKFLPPSRPFVVYCQYKEPLMECYVHLRALGAAIDIVLSTTWFRRIQALPSRTHPEVASPPLSGYLLRGMTIASSQSNENSNVVEK